MLSNWFKTYGLNHLGVVERACGMWLKFRVKKNPEVCGATVDISEYKTLSFNLIWTIWTVLLLSNL